MTQVKPQPKQSITNDNRTAKVIPFERPTPYSYTLGPHWFAVYTNIKSERRACAALQALGYRTYFPEMTKWVRHARVSRVVHRPLMCRYIFVEIEPSKDGFGEIRTIDGVEAIVGNNGIPMIIPKTFVEEMIGRQMKGEFDFAHKEAMPKGAKIRVVDGEWEGTIGVITSESNAHAGSLMVKLLNERYERKIGAYALRPYMGEALDTTPKTV
jgi:transcription antitermination factor NusG